jgi:hypothetical protein
MKLIVDGKETTEEQFRELRKQCRQLSQMVTTVDPLQTDPSIAESLFSFLEIAYEESFSHERKIALSKLTAVVRADEVNRLISICLAKYQARGKGHLPTLTLAARGVRLVLWIYTGENATRAA